MAVNSRGEPKLSAQVKLCAVGELPSLDKQRQAIQTFPTPTASIADHGGPNQRDSSGRPGLQMVAQFWATPNTMDYLPQRSPDALQHQAQTNRKGRTRPSNLREQVDPQTVAMWPTPTASAQNIHANNADIRRRKNGKCLYDAVKMFPTPTTGAGLCGGTGNYQQLQRLKSDGVISEDERRNMSQGNGGQLNPDWVEWLMGFPVGWTATDSDTGYPAPPIEGSVWPDEPEGVPRIASRIPNRVERLKCLGNAVVPAQFYPIFRAISEIMRGDTYE